MQKLLCFLLSLWFFIGNSVSAHKESNASVVPTVTTDPRPPIYRTFSLGKESKQGLHEMTLIIAWSPTQKFRTKKSGYQIWGDERILSKKQLTQSLCGLYDSYREWGDRKPHVLVMGNDWGAGRELDPLMKKLSKDYLIDTYCYGASSAFAEVSFTPRFRMDKHALKKITEAIDGVLEPERDKK